MNTPQITTIPCADCRGTGFVSLNTIARGPRTRRTIRYVARECDNCSGTGTISKPNLQGKLLVDPAFSL